VVVVVAVAVAVVEVVATRVRAQYSSLQCPYHAYVCIPLDGAIYHIYNLNNNDVSVPGEFTPFLHGCRAQLQCRPRDSYTRTGLSLGVRVRVRANP